VHACAADCEANAGRVAGRTQFPLPALRTALKDPRSGTRTRFQILLSVDPLLARTPCTVALVRTWSKHAAPRRLLKTAFGYHVGRK
jgi:hypothetical protein